MIRVLLYLLSTTLRTRTGLQLEVAALRHQLSLYQHRVASARVLHRRIGCCGPLSRGGGRGWRKALWFVQPRTVLAWQQKRFREYWRTLSRPSRPSILPELRGLIERMWKANAAWGSPRIVGKLRKLGIDVAKATVEKSRSRRNTPRR